MKIRNGHCSQSGRLKNWGSRLWEWFRKILVEGLPVLVWKDTFFISSTYLIWRMMPSNLDVPFFGWVSKDLPWLWIKSQTFNHLESGTMSIIYLLRNTSFLSVKQGYSYVLSALPTQVVIMFAKVWKDFINICLFVLVQLFVAISKI